MFDKFWQYIKFEWTIYLYNRTQKDKFKGLGKQLLRCH